MRILIAEDETIIRLDLRAMLEKAGFDVCAEAKDGEEAVTLARTLDGNRGSQGGTGSH